MNFDSALKYIFDNTRSSHGLDKKKLKEAANIVFETSKKEGLREGVIRKLCFSVIFNNCYAVEVSKKLLYACVPRSNEEFPYDVLPLALSYSSYESLKKATMMWFAGLIEYHIIDSYHEKIQICYGSLFNMMSSSNLCVPACLVLCNITERDDVVKYRINKLLQLKNTFGLEESALHLLRIYHIYRPDLVSLKFKPLKTPFRASGFLRESLIAAYSRIIQGQKESEVDQLMDNTYDKLNPYKRVTCVPEPDFTVCSVTIEKMKKKRIPVMQYKSVRVMIKNVSQYNKWQWPNNAPSLLRKPSVLALFQADNTSIHIFLSNWLEMALRTEIIENIGRSSLERQCNLLDLVISLLKNRVMPLSTLWFFLTHLFEKWDLYAHLSRILKILEYLPFDSPYELFSSVLEMTSLLLSTASIHVWCAVVNALGEMAVTWMFQRHSKLQESSEDSNERLNPLDGVYQLCCGLEKDFLAALNRFGFQSIVFHAYLNFYNKINVCSSELGLPLVAAPSLVMCLAIMLSSDISANDRLGRILARDYERISQADRPVEDEKKSIDRFDSSSTLISLVFNFYLNIFLKYDNENELLRILNDQYFSSSLLQKLIKGNIGKRKLHSIDRGLEYSSLFPEIKNFEEVNKETLQASIMKLADSGLKGFYECNFAVY